MKLTSCFFLPLTLWMALSAPAALAQADDYDRFSLSLGVFFTDRETDTRLDSSLGAPGSDVDMEEILGLDKTDSVFRMDGVFRFAPKHQINISAFDLSRSSTARLLQDIEWRDTMFVVGTEMDSDFDLSIYKIDYTWRFMQRDQGYFGATAGLYIADFNIGITGSLLGQQEVGGATAPLPVIGFRGEYDFSERWSFRADAEIFFFEYGDFDGSLHDVYAGLDYSFSEHVALGIGINSVKMDLGVTKTDLSGRLDWRYEGALLFLKFDW